jgi:hypothetical protein
MGSVDMGSFSGSCEATKPECCVCVRTMVEIESSAACDKPAYILAYLCYLIVQNMSTVSVV